MFEILVIYTAKSKEHANDFVCKMTESGVLDAIRAENGCLKYEYFLNGKDTILLYEAWESPEHQKIHMTQPHMKTAMEIKQKYIDNVLIKKLTDL